MLITTKQNQPCLQRYVMTEMTFFKKLKAIYGVRVEKADMFYTGEDIFSKKFNNDRTLNEFDMYFLL